MMAVLGITLPIFAAVALGYICTRAGLFKSSDMAILGRFVMSLALPALLFLAVATRDFSEVFDLRYMAVFALGALATMALSFAGFTAAGVASSRRAVAVMGATCPNSGFIGYPLMLMAFPDIAGQILALNFLVENFLIIPLCLVLFELAQPGGAGLGGRLMSVMLGVLRRPFVIALLAGLAVSALGLSLPATLTRTAEIFAQSAAALALFSIGGALVGLPLKGNRAIASATALSKLVLHPAMVFCALLALPLMGFAPLTGDLRVAVILSAAIPMFSIYVVFASELGHEGMASIAQIIATALSFFTISALMILLL